MTIEQLIQEEISTNSKPDTAEKPIRVSVDRDTGEFELVTLSDESPARPEKALQSYIH